MSTTSLESDSAGSSRKLRLGALVDVWMPKSAAGPEQTQRSRLVIRVTLMTLAVCLSMELKYLGENAHALALMTLLSASLQVLALVLHKSTGSARLGAHCFCFALWTLFFGIATQSGGIDSPNLIANAFLVVVAPMLLGRKEGLFWLFAALITAASQLVMTRHGLVRQTLPPADLQVTRLSECVATFTTVALTAFFYRRGQDQMRTELAREKQLIDLANQNLRVILDNTGQGFLSLDPAGCITAEYSAVISTWFRAPEQGQSFDAFLRPFDPDAARSFEMAFSQVSAGILPLELALEQLPARMRLEGKTFGIEYRTVNLREGVFDKIVVIVSDLTLQMANERVRSRQQDILVSFERILHDPEGFQDFLRVARQDVDAISSGALAPDELRRRLHTLKGNAGVMGLSSVAQQCHTLESKLADSDALPRLGLDAIEHEIAYVEERLGPLLRERWQGEVVLRASEYEAFLARVQAERPHQELAREVQSWSLGRVESHLHRLAEHARQLARRFDKHVEVTTTDNGLRAPTAVAGFWNVLVHVVRNAVDHGIESVETRALLGKGAARIDLRAASDEGRLVIEVSDDGQGINWQRVRERAGELGMTLRSQEDLMSALFAEGFSTKREITDISGRGIGLSSVGSVCSSLGIEMEADSEPNRGTTFRFVLPNLAQQAASLARARAPVAAQA